MLSLLLFFLSSFAAVLTGGKVQSLTPESDSPASMPQSELKRMARPSQWDPTGMGSAYPQISRALGERRRATMPRLG